MKILCLYCTRTQLTKAIMEDIAGKLDAELVEVTDGKDRSGLLGYLGACVDAFKKNPPKVQKPETKLPLSDYDKVIVATPIWAETWSSIAHAFFMEYGKDLPAETYAVLTHMSDIPYNKVFQKMNAFLKTPLLYVASFQTKNYDEGVREQLIKDFVEHVN